jgi:hypothetical protein
MKKRTKLKSMAQRRKFMKVLHEFHAGTLKSGSGEKVSNPKQAMAIGFSEGRHAG